MKTVAVLYSGVPDDAPEDEKDVLVEVLAVSEVLERRGFSAVPVLFSLNLESVRDELLRIGPALVFNLVESVAGMDRLLYIAAALLDACRLPYTGCRTEPLFLTTGKLTAKRCMAASGIMTPACVTADGRYSSTVNSGDRFIIKPVWEHASRGMDEGSVVSPASGAELIEMLERRDAASGCEMFAEQYIEGREFNLSLIASGKDCETLPPAEIVFDGFPEGRPRIVDYRAKWDVDSFEYRHTVRSFGSAHADGPLHGLLREVAARCWKVFGLGGYARVDFRVDDEGRPWVLEVNANPCISPDAGFAAAAARAGLSYDDAVLRIVESALL
jgi:D-alanine-D-alanine ligase